jgi:hypothetical protein
MLGFNWGIDASADDSPYRAAKGGWGIMLFPTRGGYVHACPGTSRTPVRETPAEFLDDLGEDAGIGIHGLEAVTFDGRDALVASIDPTRHAECSVPDLHPDGSTLSPGYVRFHVPSTVIVTDVEGRTVAIQVWALTEDSLAAAMPQAMAFLDGIHFTGPGTSRR